MDYEVYGGWVVLAGEGGEVGGEEFCDFDGGVGGEAVLEGLLGVCSLVFSGFWWEKVGRWG